MFETDADRLESIKALGGQLLTTDRGHFWAIFDAAFIEVVDGIESTQPVLTCRSSDVELQALINNSDLTIDGSPFKVRRIETDGAGMSLVYLKR